MKQVFIISPVSLIRSSHLPFPEGTKIYFLSDHYETYVRIKEKTAGRFEVLLLEDQFHVNLERWQNDILELFHRLNKTKNSDSYWGTHLGSKSSTVLPLIRSLIYCFCARDLVKKNQGPCAFVVDDPSLARVLSCEVGHWGGEAKWMGRLRERFYFLGVFFRLIMKVTYFFLRSVAVWFYVRSLKTPMLPLRCPKKRYLLRSWITAGCIDKNGQYKDRNFGELADYLTGHGMDVWIMPTYFNLGQSIFKQLRLMSKTSVRFIYPEKYLSLFDYLKSLMAGLKELSLGFDRFDFHGLNVGPMIRYSHWQTALSPQLLISNAVFQLFGKWSQEGYQIDKIIYPMENNTVEKTLILAAKKFYPQSEVIGFQHSVWYKEQMAMFLHPEEASYHPLPHKVVCSGKKYLKILQTAGVPRQLLIDGPNLRFTDVFCSPVELTREVPEGRKRLLVILSYDLGQCMEMLDKLRMALHHLGPIDIQLKSHPLINVPKLENFLTKIGFPAYRWVHGKVQDLLACCDAAMMVGGSVSNLETIIMGVPLIRVSLENNFNLNPLWDNYPLFPMTHSAEKLAKNISLAFSLNDSQAKDLREFGHQLRQEYFSPLSAENLKVFL